MSATSARQFPICKDHQNADWNQPALDGDACVLCRLFYLEAQEELLEQWQQRAMRAEDAIKEMERPLDAQMARLNETVTRLNDENERLRATTNRALRACCAGNTDDDDPVRCQSYEASEQNAPCPSGRCVMAEPEESQSAMCPPSDEISAEVERAVAKFPTWPTDPLHALAVLGEEFGELTKEMLQLTYEPHKTSAANVRAEAIQTAAMALRLYRSLDRYEYRPGDQHKQASEGDKYIGMTLGDLEKIGRYRTDAGNANG